MSDLPNQPENLLLALPADKAHGDLLEPWLKGAQAAPPTDNAGKMGVCEPAMQFLADFDVKQPKAPDADANQQQWQTYNEGVKEWRNQWNNHVDQFDKMIKYDRLDDHEKADFKDWLHNVTSPQDPNKPNYLKGDDKAQVLEKELTNPADAKKWLDAINTLKEYEQKCAARHV